MLRGFSFLNAFENGPGGPIGSVSMWRFFLGG